MEVLEFREGLTRGIYESLDIPRNAQRFNRVKGCKANQYGFVPCDTITNPLATWMTGAGITVSWPFPQFYRGKQLSLLMTETAVYIINETAWTGALPATSLNVFSMDGAYTIVGGGGPWHVIDLGNHVILINDTNVLYATSTELWGTTQACFRCGAEFHGRVVLSGFETDTYARAQWQAIARLINTLDAEVTLSLTQNSVFWSSYGGMDFLFLLMPYLAIYGPIAISQLATQTVFNVSPTDWTLSDPAMWDSVNKELDFTGADTASQVLATSTAGTRYCVGYLINNYAGGSVTASLGATVLTPRFANGYYFEEVVCPSAGATLLFTGSADASLSIDNVQVYDVQASSYGMDKPFYLDHIQRGDMGILPVPWQGTQRAIKPLGATAIIYSDNGVGELFPFDSESGPTFGFKKLLDTGIKGRGAVHGDDGIHLMVDKTGCVWRFRPGQKPERLQYEWIFDNQTDVIVTFDSTREQFYIGGVEAAVLYCHLYTASGGMTEIPQCVTSLECGGGTLYGILTPAKFTTFTATTTPFDLGTREPKTLRKIEVGGTTKGVPIVVSFGLRESVDVQTWIRSAYQTIGANGSGSLAVTAVEFNMRIDIASLDGVEIDYIKLFWTPDGKQSVRQILGGWQ